MNLRQNQKGFTIVELLIVVVVIAILAAISIVAYTGITNRANRSAAMEAANAVKSVATTFNGTNGSWPTTKAEFVSGYATSGDVNNAIAKLPSDICFTSTAFTTTAPADNLCGAGSKGSKTVFVQKLGATAAATTITGFNITYYDYVDKAAATMQVGTGVLLTDPIVSNS